MSCENGEVLNKRNCPLCGACVILCKKNIQAQQSMHYINDPEIINCHLVCTNCGTEFDARFYMDNNHPVTEDRSVTIEANTPSVDILGQTNFGKPR